MGGGGPKLTTPARFAPLRRHRIDCHLGHWGLALTHLLAAGPAHHDAVLDLARDRGLLRQLLALCERPPAELAAAALADQQQHQQAQQRQQGTPAVLAGAPVANGGGEGQGPLATLRLRALEAYAEMLEAKHLMEDAGVGCRCRGVRYRGTGCTGIGVGEFRWRLRV